ncbi:translation initiation factor if-2 [Streptomyces xiamenensis]|uniref:Translation initiation factor if-2 n=1 Tax=Streptomyces xiamenensis TaxID=408015 RepID=A0A0F7FUB7_9ACTN|nr:hypothetical protein [Streptomyces xiamenensis]AKG43754.1 translation initiation factor if-2 [Streptomyces xiamenensis]
MSGPRHRPERYDPAWATLRPLPAVDVLGVARTLTSATRLRDLVRLLPPQDVELFFTINTGSAFSAGLEEYVRSLPGRFLTWEEATAPGRSFDLAVAFAVHPSMREVDAPLMVLPHGVGYNRLVPEVTDGGLGAPGEAAARVRRALYGFFAGRGVREPAGDAREALGALPDPPRRTAHTDAPGVCTFDVTGDCTDGVVTLRRFPVVARSGRTEPRGFLAVTDGETSPLWRQAAEVAARTVTDAGLPAADWLERRAADSPALLVATAALSPHRCLLRLRDGRLLEAETAREWGLPRPELHPLVLGAAVNLWQYGGGGGAAEPATGGLLIRTGAAAVRVRFVPQDRTGD